MTAASAGVNDASASSTRVAFALLLSLFKTLAGGAACLTMSSLLEQVLKIEWSGMSQSQSSVTAYLNEHILATTQNSTEL